MIDGEAPYLVHCNEGKDRAGFVSALLECLMGATIDEVVEDYMETYINYYGVEKGSEKYDAIVKNNLIQVLNTTFKVEDVYKADLAAEAAEFLMEDVGLSAEEVAALKANLSITLTQVYDAGKDLGSLLGNHESVSLQAVMNGKVLWEQYLDKQYHYAFYDAEYMNAGFEYASCTTDTAVYYCFDNIYALNFTLTPGGLIEMQDNIAAESKTSFISSDMLNDKKASITEKDGFILVSVSADEDELAIMGDDVASCVETYTIDAVTREMVAVQTVYTYKNGTVEEGTVTITRDVAAPEGIKPFVAYAEQTDDLRTITFVSNPGTEQEKTETVNAPKGLQISVAPDWEIEQTMTMYVDAACTQVFEADSDTNADLTLYVKWSE